MAFDIFDIFTLKKETRRLAKILGMQAGFKVAEIGAGEGTMSLQLASLVGPKGEVYATEFDPDKVKKIAYKANSRYASNMHAILAGNDSPNLPEEPFNLIIMRKVYHHFTDPASLNNSFFRLLKPGGKLGIIDFEPKWYLRFSTPEGIPKNRGGHGIPKNILLGEVAAAGFKLDQLLENWAPGGLYCAVFSKPLNNLAV